MTTLITITNQKGGVGKTTTAVTLGHALALRGRRVLLVDLDPQGQCATSLALNPEPGAFNALINPMADLHQWVRETGRNALDLIPGDRSTASAQIVINAENRPIDAIRTVFKGLSREYDYLIFDTAPSVGGIQERAIYAADLVLIPTATEFLSSDGLAQVMELLKNLKSAYKWDGKLLGILPTFYDRVTNESAHALEELKTSFGEAVLPPIYRATVLRECVAEGVTVFEKAPASRTSQEYEELADIVVKKS
jgi:chromosome partitioning protein